jgi:hypothetical protein
MPANNSNLILYDPNDDLDVIEKSMGTIDEVEWFAYNVPSQLAQGQLTGEGSTGVIDLAPCDDGTLVVTFSDRNDGKQRIYQSTPKIDHAERRIIVETTKRGDRGPAVTTHGWTEIPDAEANRVHKQPIFCWSIVEGLATTLEASHNA